MKKGESEIKTIKKDETKKEKQVEQKNTIKKENKQSGNLFSIIAKYFRGVGTEIKRIRWTNGKELIKYSIASVAFVIFFGAYFYAIDWISLLVRSLAN